MSKRFSLHFNNASSKIAALAILLLLPLQSFNGWTQASATQPAQKPLLSRDDGQPGPNVMLTLDTSWSMIFPYVPEGAFTINNKTIIFPAFTSVIVHPDDPRFSPGSVGQGDGGVIPADLTNTTNVFPRQMRSANVNKLYYDPQVQYQPWLISKDTTTGSEVRYSNAKPSQAWFDPNKTSSTDGYADLTAAAKQVTAYWCYSSPANSGDKLSCSSGTKSFSPAVYYVLKDGTVDPRLAASYTVYDINNTTSFTKYPDRQCAGSTCTKAEELQNYANWFVYYRTRLHMVQGAIPETFLRLPDNKIRVGWGTIWQQSHNVDGSNSATVQEGVRDLDGTRKTGLANWIRNFQSTKDVTTSTAQPKLSSGTPLLAALTGVGEYFARTDRRSPWVTDPSLTNGDTSAPLTCRRSYNVLVTDGYYTDSSSIGDQDSTNGTVITNNTKNGTPSSYTYTVAKPFSDSTAGTLADVAMKYWKNDLQPSIDNKVPYGNDTTLEDPAFWQHLVQFPIGLGVAGNIATADGVPTSSDLAALTSGAKQWWGANPTTTGRIDDLLHAAVNSRGLYFSAKSPKDLVSALTTALSRASQIPGIKEGGVGVASVILGGADNVKYVPEYTTGSWLGDVKAYALDKDGNASITPSWNAASKVPAYAGRNIFTWAQEGAATVGTGASFNWASLGQANQALITPTLPTAATGEQLVDYVRGDTTNEDSNGNVKLFRKRTGSLPDFINSNPVLIKGNVSLGYDQLPSGTAGQSTYGAFVAAKAARPSVLFVGGNGGMLHAFADYTASGVQPGQEIFAYVPKAVLPNLSALAQRTYGKDGTYHQFYVDGPLVESDAYLNGAWKNILVGTMGAGGKGLFALNVTNSTSLDASSVLWEKSAIDAPDIGYIFSAPQVGMLANGDWAVFFGNGAHSSTGKAALMVINLSTGALSELVVDASGNNGLGGVALVKNSHQQVIGLYAGDLKGNVWRFSVNTTGPTSSTTATLLYKASFTAGNGNTMPQPITAAPVVAVHPSGGYLVMIGTGKLYDDGDNDNTSVQTLYGLWDKLALNGASAFDTTSATPRSKLVQQTIGSSTASNGTNYFALSSNAVDYGNPDVLGWYIDLTIEAGQRQIYSPTIIRDVVLINTIVPAKKPDPKKPSCDGAFGSGYNFLIPILTGGQYKVRILDTNGDGLIDTKDAFASIFSSGADGNPTPITQDVNGKLRVSIQNTNGTQYAELPPASSAKTITGRVWRQIFSPPHP